MNAIVDIELPSLAANQSCSLGLPRYLARRAGLAASVGHNSRYSCWRSDDWREQFTAAARDHWGRENLAAAPAHVRRAGLRNPRSCYPTRSVVPATGTFSRVVDR